MAMKPLDTVLCRLEDVPDGGALGLLPRGNDDRVFAVRLGTEVFVWLNDCPHNHRPLELRKNLFLSADGKHIMCYAHGAHFEIRSGYCFAGPCLGRLLTAIPARVDAGTVWVAASLPAPGAD